MGERRTKIKRRICSEVSVNNPGNPWSQSWKVVYGAVRSHIIYRTRGRGGVEILLYCVIIGDGYLSQCYITHSASDSASIFQQFMGMTAPKRRGMSEIPHLHAAHLPYLPEQQVFLTVLLVNFWFGHFSGRGVVSICYITLGCGLEKCYQCYIGRVGGPKIWFLCYTIC